MRLKKKTFSSFILIILAGSLLAGCGGGADMASSWPGLAVDSDSGLVYMASNMHVYAVNLSNGTEKWRFPEKADGKINFYAAPELTEDGQLIAGAYDHNLYSLNTADGQQKWVFSGANDKYVGPSLAAGGAVYAPNVNYNLYAVDLNGGLKWNFASDQALWARPIMNGGKLLVASMDHHVYALDPENGSRLWATGDLGGAIVSSFALGADDHAFVGTLGSNMSAVDLSDGRVVWTTPVKGWVWSKPVQAEGLIFFGDQDGNVYGLDAQSGSVRWQIQPDPGPDRAVISTPVIHDTTLYFASQAGTLYAVETSTGNALWNKPIGGKIYSDLVLTGDSILIAPLEFDAALVLVDLQGNIRWTYTPAK